MATSASYTHLPLSSIDSLFQAALSSQDYKKAHHLQKAMEHVLMNSAIGFSPNGNMNLTPAFEEVLQYWYKSKIILTETLEGTTVESVRMTKGLLAFEKEIEENQISVNVNMRRL